MTIFTTHFHCFHVGIVYLVVDLTMVGVLGLRVPRLERYDLCHRMGREQSSHGDTRSYYSGTYSMSLFSSYIIICILLGCCLLWVKQKQRKCSLYSSLGY